MSGRVGVGIEYPLLAIRSSCLTTILRSQQERKDRRLQLVHVDAERLTIRSAYHIKSSHQIITSHHHVVQCTYRHLALVLQRILSCRFCQIVSVAQASLCEHFGMPERIQCIVHHCPPCSMQQTFLLWIETVSARIVHLHLPCRSMPSSRQLS